MSYIGSSAAPLPVAFAAAQAESFSGNGSTTAFTLSRSVARVIDIEVIVNNIQQSPYDSSYSLNGTTLTFSEAPSTGTNNIYVIYRDQPVGSVVPADGTITPAKLSTGGPFWNTSGNVGIGTSSPASKLNIVDASATVNVQLESATVKGQYFASTGAGGVFVGSASAHPLVFRTDTTERMRIDASGNVGIGTSSPSVRLDLSGAELSMSNVTSPSLFGIRANLQPSLVAGGTNIGNLNDARSLAVRCRYTSGSTNYPSSYGVVHAYQHYGSGEIGGGSQYITQMAFGHNDTPLIYLRNSNTSNGTTYSNWYTINTTSVSDERAKKNIVDAPDQLGILTQLEVKNFEYINENEPGVQLGMIAQQVDSVDPYYVSKDLQNPDLLWRINYDKMVPMLVKSIQEQQAIIASLTARIETLEAK